MSTGSRFYPNLYKDSVSLMTVTAQVMTSTGIDEASVVMASATNVDNLAEAGLGPFDVRPNDLVVAVSGTDEACEEALERADDLLTPRRAPTAATTTRPPPSRSPASGWRSPRTRATTSRWSRCPATTPPPRR